MFQVITTSAQSCAHPLRSRLRYALRHPPTTLMPRLFVPLARHAGRVQCVRLRAALRLHCGGGSGLGYSGAGLPQGRRGVVVISIRLGLPPPVWPLCDVIPRPAALSGVLCGRCAACCEPQLKLWLLGGFRGCATKARGCWLVVPGLRRSTAFERTPGKRVV